MGHSSGSSSDDELRSGSKKRKSKKEKKSSKKKRDKHLERTEDNDSFLDQVDKDDVDRLLLSLLQISPQVEGELVDVFKQLDLKGTVYLQDLGDPRLRKKLRHLFRALLIGEVEGERGKGWRKVPACKKSLAKFVKRCCKALQPRLGPSNPVFEPLISDYALTEKDQETEEQSAGFDPAKAARKAEEAVQRWREEQAPIEGLSSDSISQKEPLEQKPTASGALAREEWMLEAPAYLRCLAAKDGPDSKRKQILQQKKKDDEEAVRVKAVMEEWNKACKMKSLREMREEGEFAEGEEAYKRWKQSMHVARNVWGKRAADQVAEQEFQHDTKKGQPWQRFDRERDLQARVIQQVSQADYQKLLQQTQLASRFKSSWQTSFL
ncbi:uncharacterized protein LOC34619105 [Cyclospora cayetanensis]|uniref:Uncharacterized protein LOC34619105 n=1 Tax=Cyclospora cayetanensis TaxID=88456 RepID=A0A6P6RY60_9EIME|nr:uncharacterized protein LOC34619105 [Cyclospora cayetanensis]